MHYRLVISLILIGSLFINCSVTKSVRKDRSKTQIKNSSPNKTADEDPIPIKNPPKEITKKALTTNQKVSLYLQIYGPIAQQEMRMYKIPASITLAQGLLESGFGEGRLAVEGNNHFGIKCHKDWTGQRIYHDDDEKGECFRVYEDASQSYRDHSLFLRNRNRYAFLFRLGKKDYHAWARGLKKAGYATDPKYPSKLIKLIERFDLNQYDQKDKVIISTVSDELILKLPKGAQIYVVKKGDTLYSIAKMFNIEVKKLRTINKIEDNLINLGQELIITKN